MPMKSLEFQSSSGPNRQKSWLHVTKWGREKKSSESRAYQIVKKSNIVCNRITRPYLEIPDTKGYVPCTMIKQQHQTNVILYLKMMKCTYSCSIF